jgi:hypothetical protein
VAGRQRGPGSPTRLSSLPLHDNPLSDAGTTLLRGHAFNWTRFYKSRCFLELSWHRFEYRYLGEQGAVMSTSRNRVQGTSSESYPMVRRGVNRLCRLQGDFGLVGFWGYVSDNKPHRTRYNKPHVTRGMLNLEQLRKLTC